jgi:hypothetical protein
LATIGQAITTPIFQRGVKSTGMGPTSGVKWVNAAPVPVDVTVALLNPNGSVVLSKDYTLQGFEAVTFYSMNEMIPDGFNGSVALLATGGEGMVTGVVNNVDRAVQGDGSAVFTPVIVSLPDLMD